MRARKGQAAMEYLMTYGWALVALVVVIAALMATGAFNPSYLIAEECSLQPDLSCGGHLLYLNTAGDHILKMRISNGLGYDIELKEITITPSGGEAQTFGATDEIAQGEELDVEMELQDISALKGEISRMTVTVKYVSCAPEVNYNCAEDEPAHTVSGRIVARVEEESP